MNIFKRLRRAFSGRRPASCSARENCHNCRYGGQYECRRHAPIGGDPAHGPVFPSIYNQGLGTWCGDYEPNTEVTGR